MNIFATPYAPTFITINSVIAVMIMVIASIDSVNAATITWNYTSGFTAPSVSFQFTEKTGENPTYTFDSLTYKGHTYTAVENFLVITDPYKNLNPTDLTTNQWDIIIDLGGSSETFLEFKKGKTGVAKMTVGHETDHRGSDKDTRESYRCDEDSNCITTNYAQAQLKDPPANIPTANIPEPATLALMGLGLAGMTYRRRKSP